MNACNIKNGPANGRTTQNDLNASNVVMTNNLQKSTPALKKNVLKILTDAHIFQNALYEVEYIKKSMKAVL